MTIESLTALSDTDLINEFAECGKVRGTAVAMGNVPGATRAAYRMKTLDQELHRRTPSVRALLMPLLENEDDGVRYYAALRLLSTFPGPAKAAIEEVAGKGGTISSHARGTLRRLKSGELAPDWCP